MCTLDSSIEILYEKTIDDFVDKNQPFTGYDLTVATRKREGIKLRHADNNQGIHEIPKILDLIEYDDWSRSVVDLNGQQVILYHPDGFDVNQYEPMTDKFSKGQSNGNASPVVCTTAPTNVLSSVPVGLDDDDDNEQPDGSYKTDSAGRLLVRTQFLRDANMDPGEVISVFVKQGEILLCKSFHTKQGYDTLVHRKVERDGDIRLSSNSLQDAGFTNDFYTVENTTDGVVVTES